MRVSRTNANKGRATTRGHLGRASRRLVLLAGLLVGMPATGADLVLVVHRDSPLQSLKPEDVANLYLGKRKSIGDIPLQPIEVRDRELRERFYASVAGMSAVRVKAFWARQVFASLGRPPIELPEAEGLKRVAATPGILTYTTADKVTPDLKIVLRLP
jgi:hypothetical protein